MSSETNLAVLVNGLKPRLNAGEWVFCSVFSTKDLDEKEIIGYFKESEGLTTILSKMYADSLGLNYSFVASWITLQVHSALEAVGLTAAFSHALAQAGVGCNVIAGYYHDHIFVNRQDQSRAMEALDKLSSQ